MFLLLIIVILIIGYFVPIQSASKGVEIPPEANSVSSNVSLTIVALPYPVRSEKLRNKYFLTFCSWLLTSPRTKIQIMMPPYEFDPDGMILPTLESLFGKNRIVFAPSIDTDEDGVPFIDEWFIKGIDSADSDLVCWINSDIIIPAGWFPRIEYLYHYFHTRDQQIAVISRRCDFWYSPEDAENVYEKIKAYANDNSLKNIWPPDFDKISESRDLHSTWGIDFFLVSKDPMQINFDDIPPFHMGKYRWDPWITGWLRKHMPLITLGDDFCTYHMNHVPKERSPSDVKCKENFEHARRHGGYNVPNGLASYYLRGRKLFQKNNPVALDRIPDWIPKSNAPYERENITVDDS